MTSELDPRQIEAELKNLEGWEFKDDALHRKFKFKNFTEAMAFLVRVGFVAEKQDHHPVIHNIYNSVTLSLQSHDAGNKVTEKDIRFASAINAL